MAEYHRNNVDSSFRADLTDTYAVPRPNDPLEVLAAELAALALPASVEYSLEAMGAGMVAAAADGPLPVGDILLAAATASAAVVVAANWNLVSTKWSRIINAFTTAFSTMVSNIRDAFAEVESEVPNIQSAPPVRVVGDIAYIGDQKFYCNYSVDSLTKKQVQNNKYYIALLDKNFNNVWVDLDRPISFGFAKFVIAANNYQVGILAVSKKDARGLAGPDPIGPEIHSYEPGYYYHYHHPLFDTAHIWYPDIDLA